VSRNTSDTGTSSNKEPSVAQYSGLSELAASGALKALTNPSIAGSELSTSGSVKNASNVLMGNENTGRSKDSSPTTYDKDTSFSSVSHGSKNSRVSYLSSTSRSGLEKQLRKCIEESLKMKKMGVDCQQQANLGEKSEKKAPPSQAKTKTNDTEFGVEKNSERSERRDTSKSSHEEDDRGLEEERMLIAALPNEYVVTVMRHDGQPLWWMMTHKKLSPRQLTSVLVQVIIGLAIAEHVYLYEHRDLHVSNILIKKTSGETIPFVVDGRHYQVVSYGVKATIIDATFSRLTHNGRVYFRDLTSTLRAYGAKKTPPKMSLQNRSYRQMVRLTRNRWQEFNPKTNLIWLTYLCETLMKNETMRSDTILTDEVRKIRDYTLKVKTTLDLLGYFPLEKGKPSGKRSSTCK